MTEPTCVRVERDGSIQVPEALLASVGWAIGQDLQLDVVGDRIVITPDDVAALPVTG